MDTNLDRLVAVKVLPPEKVADADRKRRFIQEAKAASALNHPNIVTIYDIDSADGIDFIAMEFVAGKTLDRCIPRHGGRLDEALKYSVQIADALVAAHKAGIVHRDLKPSNVMITEHGLVKVLDFGLAKLTESTAPADEATTRTLKPTTEEGAIVGTVSYMSPEQAEGKKVDARSDIFTFGAVLYEMVTGRRAFQGDSRLATLTAILHEEPKPASQVAEGLPRELERIIARCLRKDPARRFQAMPDLKVALEELKEESTSGTLDVATVPQRRRRWRLAWTVAFLAEAGVVSTLWFVRPATKAPEPPMTAVPLITYPGLDGEPTFSPDGNQVAFTWFGETRDNEDIYVKLIGTTGSPLRLTTDAAKDYSPAWSPDGRFIAFLRNLPRAKCAVLLIPALGGRERKLAEIHFDSARTGQQQVWKIPADGGEAIQVTRDGGFAQLESPDGKFLYYVKRLVGTELWRLPVEGGQAVKILEGLTNYLNLAIVGEGIYFVPVHGATSGFSIQFLNLATSQIIPVAKFEKPLDDFGDSGGLAISPDSRWILYTQFDQTGGELMLVENFR